MTDSLLNPLPGSGFFSEAWDLVRRIPPLWLVTLGLAVYSCAAAARQGRNRDALLLLTMLLSCLFCVIYLCRAGNVL